MTFAALDFETANRRPESACAVGVVRIERGRIVARAWHLIRPPSGPFTFRYLHGIGPADVRPAPPFPEVWRRIRPLVAGTRFVAAHNAQFDARVLRACCSNYGLPVPRLRFLCTVELARSALGITPANLASVCRRLGIALEHHDPLSDAEACARIVLAARAGGVLVE